MLESESEFRARHLEAVVAVWLWLWAWDMREKRMVERIGMRVMSENMVLGYDRIGIT